MLERRPPDVAVEDLLRLDNVLKRGGLFVLPPDAVVVQSNAREPGALIIICPASLQKF